MILISSYFCPTKPQNPRYLTWKQTMMYGVLSSHLAMMSCMLNWSGIFSLMSSTIVFTLAAAVAMKKNGDDGHLLLPGRGGPSPAARLPWLQFKDGLEEFLRGGREEPDLGVWVQPVQVRRLLHMVGLLGTCYNNYLWKIVVDVVVVTNVVHVWRRCKPLRMKIR